MTFFFHQFLQKKTPLVSRLKNRQFQSTLEYINIDNERVLKALNHSDPNNYRPISLTSTSCKLLETVIRDSIIEQS